MNRRTFLGLSSAAVCGLSLHGLNPRSICAAAQEEPFLISLAQWSLHKNLFKKKISNLDFAKIAKEEFDIDCIEYVDQFFVKESKDPAYVQELRQRADDLGVKAGLIMIDSNGSLGDSDERKRKRAIDKTFHWIDVAATLGCATIRVNARGGKDPEELKKLVIDSCVQLSDYAAKRNINVTIENHGGPSSDPVWLCEVMQGVNKANFGTLPDFGNFPKEIDRYNAVEMMMPYAHAVSAKACGFTPEGLVKETDYNRMMRIVRDHGYTGYVGVESVGKDFNDEYASIRKTRDLLLKIREDFKQTPAIFNGQDLEGWTVMAGGEWTVEDGVLIGKMGKDWSTDPERTGSWLRTNKEYKDFRLELQYNISKGGNSGVFFRSGIEKNPAFTGYEMQIYDAPGTPPTKQGPTAIYDVVAPTENRVRPAGEWNTVSIEAKGKQIKIEMNGVQVMDTELERSASGYIGVQNHDEKAVVQYKNIRVREL